MEGKKLAYKGIAIAVAGMLIILACFLIVKPAIDKQQPQSETTTESAIPEDSSLNNLNVNLIDYYTQGYKNVSIEGNNLINGSFANRTVFCFSLTGVSDLNKMLEKIELFQGEKKLSCNVEAHQYVNSNDILVIAACDNKIENENINIKITAKDNSTNETAVLNKTLTTEKTEIPIEEKVSPGQILKVSDNGYWIRLNNDEDTNTISKQDSDGAYFEYTRTLNFISFGTNNAVNLKDLNLYTELNDYNLNIDVYQKDIDSNTQIYNQETSTGSKQIVLTFRINDTTINDETTLEIIDKINNSYFMLNGQYIYIG